MRTITQDPLTDALVTLGDAHEGIGAALTSINAAAPPKDAPPAVLAEFRARLAEVLEEAQRSLSMAAGDMAFHHRRQTVDDLVAAASARSN